jgi:cytochrome c oxidase subunit 3
MPVLTEPTIGGPPPVGPELPYGGGGDDSDRQRPGSKSTPGMIGIITVICASVMTFGAMAGAMILRRGLNNDWRQIPVPHILWWNTVALVLSSVAIDAARRFLRHDRRQLFTWYWSAGALLGTLFLVGQAMAWLELYQRGYFLSSGVANAFFYVITWAHAAHVVGALLAVYYVEYRALRYELPLSRRSVVTVSALFWHFLDVMWLVIMGLFVWWA